MEKKYVYGSLILVIIIVALVFGFEGEKQSSLVNEVEAQILDVQARFDAVTGMESEIEGSEVKKDFIETIVNVKYYNPVDDEKDEMQYIYFYELHLSKFENIYSPDIKFETGRNEISYNAFVLDIKMMEEEIAEEKSTGTYSTSSRYDPDEGYTIPGVNGPQPGVKGGVNYGLVAPWKYNK